MLVLEDVAVIGDIVVAEFAGGVEDDEEVFGEGDLCAALFVFVLGEFPVALVLEEVRVDRVEVGTTVGEDGGVLVIEEDLLDLAVVFALLEELASLEESLSLAVEPHEVPDDVVDSGGDVEGAEFDEARFVFEFHAGEGAGLVSLACVDDLNLGKRAEDGCNLVALGGEEGDRGEVAVDSAV